MTNRTSTALSTSLILGARGAYNDTDGCYLSNSSGGTEKYLIGAVFTIGTPGPLFTPASHEADATLHLTADEHTALSELLANKDALLALLNQ